jgi:hypothetical protein
MGKYTLYNAKHPVAYYVIHRVVYNPPICHCILQLFMFNLYICSLQSKYCTASIDVRTFVVNTNCPYRPVTCPLQNYCFIYTIYMFTLFKW